MKKWTDEEYKYLVELKEKGLTWQLIAERMTEKFDEVFHPEQCRSKWRNTRIKNVSKNVSGSNEPVYKENIQIKEDGTHISDKLIELDEKQMKDPTYILLAHGYDPKQWKIVKVEMSRWHYRDKENTDGKISLASRLIIKPLDDELSTDHLIEIITENTEPLKINTTKHNTDDKRLLGIELMDMHFGINTLDDYQDTIRRLTERLESRKWDRVAITFGSDLMHVDNLKNTTANQTRIDDVDIMQMIEDVKSFYEYLVSLASKQANEVKVIYIKGNHDETTSALLIHWLDARFRDVDNVEVDTSIEEVKVYTWERIFVALTHGDKGGKRTKNTLSTNYPLEWARSKVREFHKGHLHHEKALDEFGITERTLPTGAKTDQYHKDNSFDSAHKRFMIFEYSSEWLESIHYV